MDGMLTLLQAGGHKHQLPGVQLQRFHQSLENTCCLRQVQPINEAK